MLVKSENNILLRQDQATSVYTLAEGTLGDSLGNFLYSANQQANEAVQDQLSALSVTRFFFPWFFLNATLFLRVLTI